MTHAAVTLSALALFGCASSGQTVQVKGATVDMVRIAGDWEGDYTGSDSGRAGRIAFNLGMGRHTATGQVTMLPNGTKGAPQPLTIELVKVDDRQVSGTIAPYMDPQCRCEVRSSFLGELEGDVIDGTFVSQLSGIDRRQTGVWSVIRK